MRNLGIDDIDSIFGAKHSCKRNGVRGGGGLPEVALLFLMECHFVQQREGVPGGLLSGAADSVLQWPEQRFSWGGGVC